MKIAYFLFGVQFAQIFAKGALYYESETAYLRQGQIAGENVVSCTLECTPFYLFIVRLLCFRSIVNKVRVVVESPLFYC